MSGFLTVLALASLPALGNFAGGVLADMIRVSPRVLSFALHAAAGIVFAVVGVELMPEALAAEPVWLIVLLFVAGGGFAVLIDWIMGAVRLRSRTGSAEAGAEAGPWSIYFGVAVDLFSDGVMIGAGSTISPALGLLLSLGQVPADIPEGFATIATFKAQGMARRRRLLLAASFAIPIVLGATISYFTLRGRPDIYKLGLLAFTAGILLTVAVEEIVVEAHREDDSRMASLFLVGGFALFVAIGEFLEERSGGWEGGEQTATVTAQHEMRLAAACWHTCDTPKSVIRRGAPASAAATAVVLETEVITAAPSPVRRVPWLSWCGDQPRKEHPVGEGDRPVACELLEHGRRPTLVAVELRSQTVDRDEDHVLGESPWRFAGRRHLRTSAAAVTGSATGAASMCAGSVSGSPSAERAA